MGNNENKGKIKDKITKKTAIGIGILAALAVGGFAKYKKSQEQRHVESEVEDFDSDTPIEEIPGEE